jgi:hypothetical protein
MEVSKDLWRFENMDPERAARLSASNRPDALCAKFCDALERGLAKKGTEFGIECGEVNDLHRRIIIHLHVGEDLFDLFFNGLSGYRAQFRRGPEIGLAFNASLIAEAKAVVERVIRPRIVGRLLDAKFSDLGPIAIEKDFVLRSLDVGLSKVWMPTRRIPSALSDGSKADAISLGISNEKLVLAEGLSWTALSRTEDEAWLEIKGAFVGDRLYQPKDPFFRAITLSISGTA